MILSPGGSTDITGSGVNGYLCSVNAIRLSLFMVWVLSIYNLDCQFV